MRRFFWYPLIGIIIGSFVLLKIFNTITGNIPFFINMVSLLFHFSFLTYFIYNTTNKTNTFKIINYLIFTTLIFFIISDIITFYHTAFAFANSCLFFSSLYYFFITLNRKEKVNLSGNPFFYICCGIFIGSGLIVPGNLMIKYMRLQNLPKDSLYLVISVTQSGYIIMNAFFIKGLLCVKRGKEFYSIKTN